MKRGQSLIAHVPSPQITTDLILHLDNRIRGDLGERVG